MDSLVTRTMADMLAPRIDAVLTACHLQRSGEITVRADGTIIVTLVVTVRRVADAR